MWIVFTVLSRIYFQVAFAGSLGVNSMFSFVFTCDWVNFFSSVSTNGIYYQILFFHWIYIFLLKCIAFTSTTMVIIDKSRAKLEVICKVMFVYALLIWPIIPFFKMKWKRRRGKVFNCNYEYHISLTLQKDGKKYN